MTEKKRPSIDIAGLTNDTIISIRDRIGSIDHKHLVFDEEIGNLIGNFVIAVSNRLYHLLEEKEKAISVELEGRD